jgi:hypothetical protein
MDKGNESHERSSRALSHSKRCLFLLHAVQDANLVQEPWNEQRQGQGQAHASNKGHHSKLPEKKTFYE